jgi:hypothetical protein
MRGLPCTVLGKVEVGLISNLNSDCNFQLETFENSFTSSVD